MYVCRTDSCKSYNITTSKPLPILGLFTYKSNFQLINYQHRGQSPSTLWDSRKSPWWTKYYSGSGLRLRTPESELSYRITLFPTLCQTGFIPMEIIQIIELERQNIQSYPFFQKIFLNSFIVSQTYILYQSFFLIGFHPSVHLGKKSQCYLWCLYWAWQPLRTYLKIEDAIIVIRGSTTLHVESGTGKEFFVKNLFNMIKEINMEPIQHFYQSLQLVPYP